MGEVKTLMQGNQLIRPEMCAPALLPAAKELQSIPPAPPRIPHEFHEPVDMTGLAIVRRQRSLALPSSSTSHQVVANFSVAPDGALIVEDMETEQVVVEDMMGRGHSAQPAEVENVCEPPAKKIRKPSCCRKCKRPLKGHPQYKGKHFCSDVGYDEWLAERALADPNRKKK